MTANDAAGQDSGLEHGPFVYLLPDPLRLRPTAPCCGLDAPTGEHRVTARRRTPPRPLGSSHRGPQDGRRPEGSRVPHNPELRAPHVDPRARPTMNQQHSSRAI